MSEPKPDGKPFVISKRLVWEAWRRVKANRGAAGVDEESILAFEANLMGEPLQGLEADVLGELCPAAGEGGRDTEEVGRIENARRANYRG
jgi:hypothetical protein